MVSIEDSPRKTQSSDNIPGIFLGVRALVAQWLTRRLYTAKIPSSTLGRSIWNFLPHGHLRRPAFLHTALPYHCGVINIF